MTPHGRRLTVYADYVCPFCYLGSHVLETVIDARADPVTVDWQPFDLRGDQRGPDDSLPAGVDDWKAGPRFEQAKRTVADLRDRYGAQAMVAIDAVPDGVDSFDAQVASWYVRREHRDRWPAFDDAIYRAHWETGADIGDHDVIASCADAAGLDPAEIRSVVTDDRHRRALHEQFDSARRRGIDGVPTFIVGGSVFRGAVPPARLHQLLDGE